MAVATLLVAIGGTFVAIGRGSRSLTQGVIGHTHPAIVPPDLYV